MSRLISQRFVICLAILLSFPTSWVAAQDSLMQYLPPNAMAATRMTPKAMFSAPDMQILPMELVKVFGQKELGIELMELEEVLAFVATPADPEMREPPAFAVLFRFATPQKLGGRLLAEFEPEQREIFGKPGYVMDEVKIVQFDERTFGMGIDTNYLGLAMSLKGSKPRGKLADLMSGDMERHFAAYLMIDPVRSLIKQNLPSPDEIPAPFRKYLKLADLVSYASYSFSVSGKKGERLVIGAADEAGATEIQDLVKEGLDFGKHMAMSWLAAESQISDPDYQQAIVDYSNRIMGMVNECLDESRDGDKLVFEIDSGGMGGIGTTGVLVGMLLPAVQQVRGAARRADSANRLRQAALGFHNYTDAYRRFPQSTYSPDGKPLLSWRVHILPFMEEQALYEQFKLDEPWDSEHNRKLIPLMPGIYTSPDLNLEPGMTNFLGVAGPNSIFQKENKRVYFTNVTDGTSLTAMFVEADASEAVVWTKPADWNYDPANPMRGLGGVRPAGFNCAFADASTHLISGSIDPQVWAKFCTMNGGEIANFEEID